MDRNRPQEDGAPIEAAQENAPASAFDEAIRQALAAGLIDEADLVDADLTVSSSARRTLYLRIERRLKRSYLIKMADPGSGAGETVSNEASFYQFCCGEPAAARVMSLMPPFVDTFESGRMLVLELVQGARPLWHEYREHGPPELPPGPARALGGALGTLHSTFAFEAGSSVPRPQAMREEAPDCFSFHEPHPEMSGTMSPARLDLCRCLHEEPAVCEGLPAARAGWRAETVIHGDVRSENILVVDRGSKARQVLLADWELTQLGDPAWDLAGAFEDHLRFWIENMSQQPDLEAAERLATARWPLAAVQAAVRSLCAGYAEALDSTPASLAPRLERAVVYSAARLILTAWENCRHLERLSSLAVLLLQLAANILSDPERTAVELYGLEEYPRGSKEPAGYGLESMTP